MLVEASGELDMDTKRLSKTLYLACALNHCLDVSHQSGAADVIPCKYGI